MPRFFFIFSLFFVLHAAASEKPASISEEITKLAVKDRKAIFSRLDPKSLTKQLAFYRLFAETDEGKKAYKQACFLLQGKDEAILPVFPAALLDSLVNTVASNPSEVHSYFSSEELEIIDTLAADFPNRKLKGYALKDEQEILKLHTDEIDLARALLVSQGAADIERLEATFDIMALHIRAHLRKGAEPLEIIDAMTTFIFDEMGFRFPPQSAYIPDIEKFTSLPSVVDARKGVCLGVSILYLSLAQRLGLPLKVITPPGHIFVRYEGKEGSFNIETTARGVHIPDRAYLNLEYLALDHRPIKEVVGMSHMNEAALHWKNGRYEKALSVYAKALPYMPEDTLLHELMGYNELFLHHEQNAKEHFAKANLKESSFANDWIEGRCDIEGIELLFKQEDKNRNALRAHRDCIEKKLIEWPNFRAGWFYHGSASLELGRMKEALSSFERYHELHPKHPTAEYLLTELYIERGQYKEGWKHQKLLTDLFPKDPPTLIEELRVKLLEKSYK